jgi:lysophospholipase L1-like esterase
MRKMKLYLSFSLILNAILLAIICYVFITEQNISWQKGKIQTKFEHGSSYLNIEAWANTLSKLEINADAVFYGNSITFESRFHEFFPDKVICNMGCNGDDLDDLANRSFLIKSVCPKKIFILGGINSLNKITLEQFKQKYQVLVDTIKYQNPKSELYLQSLLPVNTNLIYGKQYLHCIDKIKQANSLIKSIAKKSGCTFIDLYSKYQEHDSLPEKFTEDGLHIIPTAYSIWADHIYKYLYSP